MSIIQFWSPLHGQGQTSNIHVTAFEMSMVHKKKLLLMQTHFSKNNLESPLVGWNVDRQKVEDEELFTDIGLDVAVTYSNMNSLNVDILEHCCLTYLDSSLLLLPGTETKNRETFDKDIGSSVCRLIRNANECVDVVLIDSNSGDDELSNKVMTIADLIVVNLSQRRYVLEKLFTEYGEMLLNNKKIFYLFGDYDDNSSYNINNCRRKYDKYINSNNSGVIPYSTKYMDAQNESDIIRFMEDGLRIKQGGEIEKIRHLIRKYFHSGKYEPEETDYFFHRSRLAVDKMLDMLHVPVRKDRREGGKK